MDYFLDFPYYFYFTFSSESFQRSIFPPVSNTSTISFNNLPFLSFSVFLYYITLSSYEITTNSYIFCCTFIFSLIAPPHLHKLLWSFFFLHSFLLYQSDNIVILSDTVYNTVSPYYTFHQFFHFSFFVFIHIATKSELITSISAFTSFWVHSLASFPILSQFFY